MSQSKSITDARLTQQQEILRVLKPSPVSPFLPWERYQGVPELVAQTPLILLELLSILRATTWSEYGNGDYTQQPEYTDMGGQELINYLRYQYQPVQGTKKWRLFGLVAQGIDIPENVAQAPHTHRLGKQISGLVSLGFSLLEAGGQTDIHRGYDATFYRFHLPLVIPERETSGKSKCFFWIDGRRVEWNSPFMFDDTRIHGAWNFTTQDRYVLIIDILR